MQQSYMGIDIGGESGTWMCVLKPNGDTLTVVESPRVASLEEIVQYAEQYQVVAVAIDAQLTWAISDKRGFRPSDLELRDILPKQCINWVASQNSLMAVPVRGRQLAEYLSPVVGTIIETHPRVCLYFADNSLLASVMLYKSNDGATHTEKLLRFWIKRFHIDAKTPMTKTHDALDSMVCATVAYLYHHLPDQLKRLSYVAEDKRGRGPFVVIEPN